MTMSEATDDSHSWGAIAQPSALERVSGALSTDLAATLIAAFSGMPVAALLPVLTNALASGRHKERVERALGEIAETLEAHATAIRDLSDAQYKAINETVLTVLQTVEDEKLAYLKHAVRNLLKARDLRSQEADVLSRVIRDISADEMRFLIEHRDVERFQISDTEGDSSYLKIPVESGEALVVTGLISLGLLIPGEPTWDESGLFRYARVVPTLIELVAANDV